MKTFDEMVGATVGGDQFGLGLSSNAVKTEARDASWLEETVPYSPSGIDASAASGGRQSSGLRDTVPYKVQSETLADGNDRISDRFEVIEDEGAGDSLKAVIGPTESLVVSPNRSVERVTENPFKLPAMYQGVEKVTASGVVVDEVAEDNSELSALNLDEVAPTMVMNAGMAEAGESGEAKREFGGEASIAPDHHETEPTRLANTPAATATVPQGDVAAQSGALSDDMAEMEAMASASVEGQPETRSQVESDVAPSVDALSTVSTAVFTETSGVAPSGSLMQTRTKEVGAMTEPQSSLSNEVADERQLVVDTAQATAGQPLTVTAPSEVQFEVDSVVAVDTSVKADAVVSQPEAVVAGDAETLVGSEADTATTSSVEVATGTAAVLANPEVRAVLAGLAPTLRRDVEEALNDMPESAALANLSVNTSEQHEKVGLTRIECQLRSGTNPDRFYDGQVAELARLAQCLSEEDGGIPPHSTGDETYSYSGDFRTKESREKAFENQIGVVGVAAVLKENQRDLESFAAIIGSSRVEIKQNNDLAEPVMSWVDGTPGSELNLKTRLTAKGIEVQVIIEQFGNGAMTDKVSASTTGTQV